MEQPTGAITSTKSAEAKKRAQKYRQGVKEAKKKLEKVVAETQEPAEDSVSNLTNRVLRRLADFLKASEQLMASIDGRETEARKRLKKIYTRYRLADFGIPWDDDLGAADNAIILCRSIAQHLVSRWCFMVKLKQAVDSGDEAKIVAQAKMVLELTPQVLDYTDDLYRAACRLAKEFARENDRNETAKD